MIVKLDLHTIVSGAVVLYLRVVNSYLDAGYSLVLHPIFHLYLPREGAKHNAASVLENLILPVVIQNLPYAQLLFCSQKLELSQW